MSGRSKPSSKMDNSGALTTTVHRQLKDMLGEQEDLLEKAEEQGPTEQDVQSGMKKVPD